MLSYSGLIGSDPGPMAISADGRALFVGLRGTGDVVRLVLPSMEVLDRARLPLSAFSGQSYAADLAASPVAEDVVAVSMAYENLSPSHAGVALLRGMLLQSRMTQGHTGSNRIAFDASGGVIWGLNNENSEFGLRRVDVLADGVREVDVRATNIDFGAGLDVRDGIVMAGPQAYRADATAPRLGTVSGAHSCVKIPGVDRVACAPASFDKNLVIAETATFSIVSLPQVADGLGYPSRVIAGPDGQVAVSDGARIYLLVDDELRQR